MTDNWAPCWVEPIDPDRPDEFQIMIEPWFENDILAWWGQPYRGPRGWPCVYCGDTADSIDHVVPRSRGGGEEQRNLMPACGRCNSRKGARDAFDWMVSILENGGRDDPSLLGALAVAALIDGDPDFEPIDLWNFHAFWTTND